MIESLLGRIRGEKQYSSRVIDIDILFYEDLIIDEDKSENSSSAYCMNENLFWFRYVKLHLN